MPSIEIPPTGAAFTADGTSKGVATVASTSTFYPSQQCWLSSGGGVASVFVQVVDVISATTMSLRVLTDPGLNSQVGGINYNYGSDISAFTVANSARIDAARQLVRVEQPTFSKLGAIG
jgi:hypothetical protein